MNQKSDHWAKYIIPLFIVLIFFRFYVEKQVLIDSLSIVMVGGGIIIFLQHAIKCFSQSTMGAWMITMIAGNIACIGAASNSIQISSIAFVSNVGFAVLFHRIPQNLLHYKNLSIIFSIFFAIHMALGINPENIFTVSRNFISVLMLMTLSCYFILCDKLKVAPSLTVTLFCQLPFLYGIGRAGIISGTILLVIATLASENKLKTYLTSLLILIPLLTTLLTYSTEIETLLTGIERFERLGGGGQRSFINEEYIALALTNPVYIFFGAPLSAVQAIIDVDGNPHNSFIRLHTSFGLVGLILTITMLTAATIILARQNRPITALILILTLFRSAVDSTAFYGPLDFVIIYCLLEAFTPRILQEQKS